MELLCCWGFSLSQVLGSFAQAGDLGRPFHRLLWPGVAGELCRCVPDAPPSDIPLGHGSQGQVSPENAGSYADTSTCALSPGWCALWPGRDAGCGNNEEERTQQTALRAEAGQPRVPAHRHRPGASLCPRGTLFHSHLHSEEGASPFLLQDEAQRGWLPPTGYHGPHRGEVGQQVSVILAWCLPLPSLLSGGAAKSSFPPCSPAKKVLPLPWPRFSLLP